MELARGEIVRIDAKSTYIGIIVDALVPSLYYLVLTTDGLLWHTLRENRLTADLYGYQRRFVEDSLRLRRSRTLDLTNVGQRR